MIGYSEVPLQIRYQVALNVSLMLRNRSFRKAFVNEPIELHMTMKPVYGVLLDTCETEMRQEERNDVVIGGATVDNRGQM